MSNDTTTSDEDSLEMTPLGDCSVCGAGREKQRGNQEGTVQECSECGSRWERSGGKLASQFELTDCPPEPDRAPEIKPKYEWKQMKADESELDREARKANQNFATGLALIGIGGLLSLTIIGGIIGIPMIIAGLSMVGYGGAKGSSIGIVRFFQKRFGNLEEDAEEWAEGVEQSAEEWEESAEEWEDSVEDFNEDVESVLPQIGPGMDSEKSINSARNQTMLVLYILTFPITIPYLLYKHRKRNQMSSSSVRNPSE